jgi:hypothetical protein
MYVNNRSRAGQTRQNTALTCLLLSGGHFSRLVSGLFSAGFLS